MSRDRTRGRPPGPDQDLPNGPPRNVGTPVLCCLYGPYPNLQNLCSTALQEGQILSPGRFVTLNIDTDGTASLPQFVNDVVSHQEQARQQDGLSSPPLVQATSQGDSLERQAIDQTERKMIYSSTARPASTQEGICQPPVLPQRQQQSSNAREVVAVPDQSGMAVRVPPSLQATVFSQGAEGGSPGFQTLQGPSTSPAVKGPESMVSPDVFQKYENKYDAEMAASNEPSNDIESQIQSENYHTAQSYIPASDQRVLGTNADHSQRMAYTIRKASMAEKEQRKRSFQGWPHRSMNLTPQRLAEAGLYFTGVNDACRCFSCGGIIHRWEEDDDPWVEHARLHHYCSYVRYVKGGLFIDQSKIKEYLIIHE